MTWIIHVYIENLFLPMAIDIASKDQKEEKSSS